MEKAGVIIFSLLAALAAMGGVYFVRHFGIWAKKNIHFLISFAVGVLLANAFLHLLPEAAVLTPAWPLVALGVIVLFYVIEHAIVIHCCAEEQCEVHALGTMGLVGIGFHSLVDGLAIGIAFQAGAVVGLLASLAVIFHKVAEGVCIYSLLFYDKKTSRLALPFSWLVAAMTPLGALAVYFLAGQLSVSAMGWLLAAAAGSFIYIGASDLVPATHKQQSVFNVLLLVVGVILVWLVGRFSAGI